MANTWWIVATGNINSSTPFASSSGGSGGAGTPATGDTIIGDAASNHANLTINAATSLAAFDMQGGGTTGNFNGTITHGAFTLTISTAGTAAFRLCSGMTYTPASTSSIVAFTNTTGTAALTSAGKNLAAITITGGASGIVQQQDNLNVTAFQNSNVTLTSGTLDSYNGGANYTLTTTALSTSNSNARTYIGGGTLTLGGNISNNAVLWNSTTNTNFTYTRNSQNIVINGPTAAGVNLANFTPGAGWATTFGNLTINNSNYPMTFAITVSMTFGVVSMGWNWAVYQTAGTTMTVSSLTITGAPATPSSWNSTAANSAAGISSSGASTVTWATFFNIIYSGAGALSGTNCLVTGGLTTGFSSVTPPSALTAAAVATSVWQDLLAGSDFGTASSVGALMNAIANLQYTVQTIGRGTVGAGSTTTSVVTSAFAPAGAAAGQFIGRIMIFDWNTTTAALRGEIGVITGSSNAAAPVFTVTGGGASATLTTAPVSTDTFSVM